MRAIIFARVSTQEQMREGQSIPAQLGKMREYCQHKGFEIQTEYRIDESSTKDERAKFEQVIEQIRTSKEKLTLIIETVDRLQRSFRESVVLDDLRKKDAVEIHFLRENLVISVNSNSSDLIRWDMAVMFARSYVLQLSDNVKRSIEQKLRNGEWPGKAPYGYKNTVNDDGKNQIVIDEYASRIVGKAYELYATGGYSMQLLCKKLKDDYSLTWSKSFLDKVFNNSFYYGVMVMKGKMHAHRYPPVISKTLFDQVQQVKAGHNKKPFKYAGKPYIYRGLIRCGHCGLAVTPEKHKGHVYYHCTQYKGKHGAEWLREEEITNQLGAIFQRLRIPEDILQQITESLKSTHEGKIAFRNEQFEKLTQERQNYSKRIDAIYMDKLDKRITVDNHDRYHQSFRERISEIDTQLAMLQEAEDNYYITAKYLLELANRAYDLFVRSEVEERRQLLKLVLSNLRLNGKTLRYEAQKPFDTILSSSDRQLWYRVGDSNP